MVAAGELTFATSSRVRDLRGAAEAIIVLV
jgi:hypothetical protein